MGKEGIDGHHDVLKSRSCPFLHYLMFLMDLIHLSYPSIIRDQFLLSTMLEDVTYTCGASLSDLHLPSGQSEVCILIFNATTHLKSYITQ